MAAYATPRGTFAKNETTSRTIATSGTIIWPLIPWTANPTTPSNPPVSLSWEALSTTPPWSM